MKRLYCYKNKTFCISRLGGPVLGQNSISLEGGGVFTIADKAHAYFLAEKGDEANAALENNSGVNCQYASLPDIL
ncbi:Hypothetical protein Y17_3583 [Pectobacterium wasabiae CFBP 3304]|nr:hypothetical protein A7983_22875 [Pectobacterium wasabiae CFBP 3304]EJS93228.1 Hypothetical protein Y17_3583 [Pectobacterium wasabiae CFBP 3304]